MPFKSACCGNPNLKGRKYKFKHYLTYLQNKVSKAVRIKVNGNQLQSLFKNKVTSSSHSKLKTSSCMLYVIMN